MTRAKKKTLEHCFGSHSPKWEHPVFNSVFNTGENALRVCKYCGKLVRPYPKGETSGQLRAHGRYLSTVPQA